MKKIVMLIVSVVFVLAFAGLGYSEIEYQYETIILPDYSYVYYGYGASGINDSGVIVGDIHRGPGFHNGFIINGNSYIETEDEDRDRDSATHINDNGDITWVTIPGDGIGNGMLEKATGERIYISKNVSPLYAQSIYVNGLNNAGTVVGLFVKYDPSGGTIKGFFGFTLKDGVYFEMPKPVSVDDLSVRDINDANQIIGSANFTSVNEYEYRGFIYQNGEFSFFDFPGSTYTYFSKINNKGQIVGYYEDYVGRHRGFLYDSNKGTFTNIDFPDADYTYPNGINNHGEIVGKYYKHIYGEGLAFHAIPVASDINQPPILDLIGNKTVNEGETLEFTITATDPDGDLLTYSAINLPVGAAFNPQTRTFTWVPGYDDAGVYVGALFEVTDGQEMDSKNLTITVVNTNRPPVANTLSVSTDEDTSVGISLSGTDPDNDTITFHIVNSVSHGTLTGTSPNLTYTPTLNYVGSDSFTYKVKDGQVYSGEVTVNITVKPVNDPPTIDSMVWPSEYEQLLQVGEQISISGSFSDPDVNNSHTVTIDWGDGTKPDDTTVESGDPRDISGDHIYNEAGVFTIQVKVEDGSDASDTEEFHYVVVYDPLGGFVTGGGWIDSPVGAYRLDPFLAGRANFGFVSKYKKGATTPTGKTQFQFKTADLNFHSSSYEWMVIAGSKVMYKGEGTINGEGIFGFLLSAIDSDLTPSANVDRFRIKIWDKTNPDPDATTVVYDNNLEVASEDADPSTQIGGGNIVIHKEK